MNILFVLMWVLFVWILIQVPQYQTQQLASFNPHEILGLEKTATEKQIKRAYHKLSLQYHPDKNVDDPDAAQKFLLVSKAYQTLTDPVAIQNMQDYGNPDGYKGVSVTIGLPSFMTKKENEMRILVVYFILFIIIPPIGVFSWWRQAKNYHESGVLNYTFFFYCHCLTENMGPKALIKLLCLSQEYQVLMRMPFNPMEFKQLYELVKDTMGNVKLKINEQNVPYMSIGNTLVHAYVNRIPIPDTLKPLLNVILKDAHRLLNTIMDIAIAKQYLKPVVSCIELMQMLTQAMWIHDSPLKQLPHMTDEEIRAAKKKKILTLGGFKRCDQEKREKIFSDLTAEKWKDIQNVTDLLPELDMKYNYEVEDEKDIYEGDIILVTVELERVKFDPNRPEGEIRKILSEDEEPSSAPAAPVEPKKKTKKDRMNAFKNRNTHVKEGETKEGPSPDSKDDSDSDSDDESDSKGPLSEEEQERRADVAAQKQAIIRAEKDAKEAKEKAEKLKNVKKSHEHEDGEESDDDEDILPDNLFDLIPVPEKKSVGRKDVPPPLAHAVHLPVEKREKWVVFLIQKGFKKPQVVAIQRVPNLVDHAIVELRFPAPQFIKDINSKGTGEAGYWSYELHAMCDSYVGVDQMATFKIKVQSAEKLRKIQEAKTPKKPENTDPNAPPERDPLDEEEYEGYWYYLGFASIWELLLNIVVLGLLCVFIFNFLVSRGYWQRYIQPSVDFISYYTSPVWAVIHPYMAPVLTPITTAGAAFSVWLGEKLHAEPPEPLRRPRKRVNPRTGEFEVEDDDKHKHDSEQDAKAEQDIGSKMGVSEEEDEEEEDEAPSIPKATPTKEPVKDTKDEL